MFNKKNVICALFAVVLIGFSSCKNTVSIDPGISVVDKKTMVFHGLEVKVPEGVDTKLFEIKTIEEFKTYFDNKYLGGKNHKISGGEPSISYEVFEGILLDVKKKYPDLSKIPLKVSDLNRISADIPSVKKEEDVRANTDAIYEYYNTLIKNELHVKIDNYQKKSKVRGDQDGLLILITGGLYYWAMWEGLSYYMIYDSARDSDVVTFDNFGTSRDGKNNQFPNLKSNGNSANAFQHSFWNALSVKRLINIGLSKSGALTKMGNLGYAFELNSYNWSSSAVFGSSDARMDLNNNIVGRSYMESEVGWGVFGLRRMPDTQDIIDFLKPRAQSASITSTSLTNSELQDSYKNDYFTLVKIQ